MWFTTLATKKAIKALVILAWLFGSAALAQPAGEHPMDPAPDRVVTTYTLAPAQLTKARALYVTDLWLYFAGTLYGFLILWLVLRGQVVVRLRNAAEPVSRNRFFQALMVTPVFIIVVSILLLPPEVYGHHIGREYRLSVQGWTSWFRDWAVQLLIFAVVGSFVAWILYAILRRSPKRAWLHFWLAVIPIAALLTFIAPVAIDPLFNRFTLLESTRPDLVRDLESVAHRAGVNIPASRMYEMNAGAKYTGSNAYVTGFGASKRVVVWDTAIRQDTSAELMFTFGHELGHYVLGHIGKGYLFAMAVCFGLFYLIFRIANWVIRRWGEALGIRSVEDWASMPLIALIGFVLLFLATPGLNAFSRHVEHDADVYGLEVTHGLVPHSSQVAAQSFQHLGEEWLEYPYVGKFAEIWMWNHPTNSERVHFAATYDPWQQGRSPEFVR